MTALLFLVVGHCCLHNRLASLSSSPWSKILDLSLKCGCCLSYFQREIDVFSVLAATYCHFSFAHNPHYYFRLCVSVTFIWQHCFQLGVLKSFYKPVNHICQHEHKIFWRNDAEPSWGSLFPKHYRSANNAFRSLHFHHLGTTIGETCFWYFLIFLNVDVITFLVAVTISVSL